MGAPRMSRGLSWDGRSKPILGFFAGCLLLTVVQAEKSERPTALGPAG